MTKSRCWICRRTNEEVAEEIGISHPELFPIARELEDNRMYTGHEKIPLICEVCERIICEVAKVKSIFEKEKD
jgi:hypothetical protein